MTPANLSCSFGDITIILAFVPLSNSFKLSKASEEVEDEVSIHTLHFQINEL